jgi:hypothetical protein
MGLGLHKQLKLWLGKIFQGHQLVLEVLVVQYSQEHQFFLVVQQGRLAQWDQQDQLGQNSLKLQLCLVVLLDLRDRWDQLGQLGQGIQEHRVCLQVQLSLDHQGNQECRQVQEDHLCQVSLAHQVGQLKKVNILSLECQQL